jgi:hypothetical protein
MPVYPGAYSVSIRGPHSRPPSAALLCIVLQPVGILDFTARTYTQIGAFLQTFSGLGFDAKSNLYTVERATGRLYRLNTANGNSTIVGNTGFANWNHGCAHHRCPPL